MGIVYENKNIGKVYYGEKLVRVMYAGSQRVWFDPPKPSECLTLNMEEGTGAENTLSFGGAVSNLYASINGGEWEDCSNGITFQCDTGTTVSLWRAEYAAFNDAKGTRSIALATSCKVKASGNIHSLINFNEVLPDYAFHRLFQGLSSLIQAPELPDKNLSKYCYSYMFTGAGLTTAPELPATKLAEGCYRGMLARTYLTTAPDLPATELAKQCYDGMFSGCDSLVTAPELPATKLAEWCYNGMFNSCNDLTTAPELPATELAEGCYNYMFSMCESLTAAPELPATELAKNCYNQMFYDCTSLTTAPELPATELAEGCYYWMFYGCTNLTTIRTHHLEWLDGDATDNWVLYVSSSGTFYKPSALPEEYGYGRIPSGWTVVNIDETEGESA